MGKLKDNRYVKTVGIVIVSLILALGGGVVGSLFNVPFSHSNSAAVRYAGTYFGSIGIWIVVIAVCRFRKNNRHLLSKLRPGYTGNNLKTVLAIGLPFGIGINLIIAFTAMLHGDINLSFNEFKPALVLLFIISVMFQSGAEEIVDRFYLYQKVGELFPELPVMPVIVNAVVFSALHFANHGITPLAFSNIVLVGVMYSLIIYYFDSFWAAVTAHTSWNFCQNILLGLPNSGQVSPYSIFKLDAANASNSFAYNVNFGIEGTLMTSAVLAVCCVIIVVIGRKRKSI